MKINHVAIVVKDLEKAAKQYQDMLGVKDVKYETVESEGVKLAIFHLENSRIELMQPLTEDNSINKFIEKKGEGLHHIALDTENIEDEVKRMKENGANFLGDIRQGSEGTKITFVHPRSLNGVLTELCSHPND